MIRLISLLAFLSIACGATATLPTAAPHVTNYGEVEIVVPLPTLTPFVPVSRQVITLGKLNVRSCPSTQCAALGVLDEGTVVEVGALITNDDWNCHLWYPMSWTAQVGYICSEWTADVE